MIYKMQLSDSWQRAIEHMVCAAETRIRSKGCDVTIVDRMGSRDASPIPFPSFIYAK